MSFTAIAVLHCMAMLGSSLSASRVALLAVGAVASFHASFATDSLGPLIVITLYCLCQLSRASHRLCLYGGLVLGVALYGPQLLFFSNIFPVSAATVLWIVAAFWLALFLLLVRLAHDRFGWAWACILAPFFWIGQEYFRCELWPLRFTWLAPGYALAFTPGFYLIAWLGLYGLGFATMSVAAVSAYRPRLAICAGVPAFAVLCLFCHLPVPASAPPAPLKFVGIQLELPNSSRVVSELNRAVKEHPDAQLLVLPEYTFRGPVPEEARNVCRRYGKYLIAGGKDRLPDGSDYYNTAFVIGPDGNVIFQQGKCTPIQFFKDGLPAQRQEVWQSPWGRIGIAVCYDLSYRRVMDELVRRGAEALIVPTMDAEDWGYYERRYLHGRVGPMRSAEYGVPILRVCSSGISQFTDRRGHVLATAGYPGQGQMITGELGLDGPGRVPLDRYPAPACTGFTGLFLVMMLWVGLKRTVVDHRRRKGERV